MRSQDTVLYYSLIVLHFDPLLLNFFSFLKQIKIIGHQFGYKRLHLKKKKKNFG